ncbi:hypothetical protein OFM39_32025, partial [Escherichia coli]|nr:hypothetical protein [Escherichia coli]
SALLQLQIACRPYELLRNSSFNLLPNVLPYPVALLRPDTLAEKMKLYARDRQTSTMDTASHH